LVKDLSKTDFDHANGNQNQSNVKSLHIHDNLLSLDEHGKKNHKHRHPAEDIRFPRECEHVNVIAMLDIESFEYTHNNFLMLW